MEIRANTDVPPKPKQIEIKQEPTSRPSMAKQYRIYDDDPSDDDMINKQKIRETMKTHFRYLFGRTLKYSGGLISEARN